MYTKVADGKNSITIASAEVPPPSQPAPTEIPLPAPTEKPTPSQPAPTEIPTPAQPGLKSNEQEPLPAGWEMKADPKGRIYFVDHVNKKSGWVDPRILNKPLPPGWEMKTDDKGKKYFVDHVNKVSTWKDPRTLGKLRVIGNVNILQRINLNKKL
jgi:atrophin-1 interacting protein 2 (WW domain-containing E3 ubiquitin protein ligase 2)